MRKIIGLILCCFVPSSNLRHALRNRFYVKHGKTRNNGGRNNKIILVKNGKERSVKSVLGCSIYFYGDNNTVKIHEPLNRLHLDVKMHGNSNLEIKSGTFLDRRLVIRDMMNSNVFIDTGLFTNSECLVECADGADIHIGKNCAFSNNVELRSGDGHVITDAKGKKINQNKSIYISDHVWLGKYVMILKGVSLPENCVVGARSLVTKSFDKKGSVIAGVPAKVIKTGINWHL